MKYSNKGVRFISNQTGLKAVQRRKLVDEVLDQLMGLIQSGQYKKDEKLPPEPELMKLLSVGRSTVREAVKILVHAGFLEVRQGDGTYVKMPSIGFQSVQATLIPQNFEQVLEVRRMLEIEAAGLAAARRTDADIGIMRSRLDLRNEYLDKGRYAEYVAADISFHMAVVEACHNDVFSAMYKVIADGLREMLSQLILDTRGYEDNTIYHEAIYMAIKAGDSDGAKRYTAQNLDALTGKHGSGRGLKQEDLTAN
ncbi:FadR/GntR family transcriptional regulator [Paenibacillus riograndensis]|uniref:FadR/GntR family transcriptional regulator n=1 Tax=Paenibacillus riograndensis TaxID=483937 RepID=UPI001E39668B|nr:FadR/GntR family transcriptional regulator [Paenibacillus riograndensis]